MTLPSRRMMIDAIAIAVAYFAFISGTLISTRFEGGVACLWIATAFLLAAFGCHPVRQWPSIAAAAVLASALATSLYGFGPKLAPFLSVINVAEAAIAAWLGNRMGLRRDALDSLTRLGAFVLAAGIAAPLVGATTGAFVVATLAGQPFGTSWINWFTGHALGTLAFAPIFTLILGGVARRWLSELSRRRRIEAVLLLGATAIVTIGVFSQQRMPLLFLPALPVILTTFRTGRVGAAAAIVILAVIGGYYTMQGYGPVNLLAGNPAVRVQFFQFYLAATVLTAFPVAADLTRRTALYRRLRESEARYRLLTDNSTDIVMNLTVDGTIRYVSPSVMQLGGHRPEMLVGTPALDLIEPEDHGVVSDAHRNAIANPGATYIVEYRVVTPNGELRWFETHTRGVIDEAGRTTSVVCSIREVSHRKSIEAELAVAAATDPLTGLANRRAFDAGLARRLSEPARTGVPGCVAIFDLDYFKRINDRYGHAVGDCVLEAFAGIARGSVRDGDLVARLGGEEFGILLPGASIEQGRFVCERLRATVAATRLNVGGHAVDFTVSAGIATIEPGHDPAEVMRAADLALYAAKAEGRDRLKLAA